jgi:ring-1,2-phenylacetyl-CoA epoxidase subunit PaaE
MSLRFEKIKVKTITKETDECVAIELDIPLNLQPDFSFYAGQHLTFKQLINGEDIRRNYSLCSSPHEHSWRVAVKKVEKGIFSTWVNETLQAGQELEVMPPAGNFTWQKTEQKAHFVGIAAGSGITPVISIMKEVLADTANNSFTLLYGNRHRHSIIFKEEIEALKNRYMERLQVVHILSREKTMAPVSQGRIDADKCHILSKSILSLEAAGYYICGPEDMTNNVREFLIEKGIEKNKIHFELFLAGTGSRKKTKNDSLTSDKPASDITIQLDGRSFHFKLPFNSENILDAALKQGADLPFACKGGVCCTCKAKLLKGEVEMEVNYGLEHEEVEQGYILTCQSYPVTPEIVIDFDSK